MARGLLNGVRSWGPMHMMIMAGVSGLAGLVAIFENEFYVATRDYLFQFDATTWGWIHLLVG